VGLSEWLKAPPPWRPELVSFSRPWPRPARLPRPCALPFNLYTIPFGSALWFCLYLPYRGRLWILIHGRPPGTPTPTFGLGFGRRPFYLANAASPSALG
jgi:hypothetical protein